MAKKTEVATSHVKADEAFEHEGRSYSTGVHRLAAGNAQTIVEDGKAKAFKKPEPKPEA